MIYLKTIEESLKTLHLQRRRYSNVEVENCVRKLERMHDLLSQQQQELEKQINDFRKLNCYIKASEIFTETPDDFLLKAYDIVDQNLRNSEFRNSEFVKNMNQCRALVYRRLKELTGQTVSEFIRDRRLNFAACLLVDGGSNVSEVCYQVGFKHLSTFSRYFANKFGITPRDFINKFQLKRADFPYTK